MTPVAFWRLAFELTVRASARFPRLVPMVVVDAIDRRCYDAAIRETLDTAAREYRAATADTMPAPSAGWDCLGGDGPALDEVAGEEHAAMVDMHDGADCWPHSGDQRKGWIA